ncbi:MAG: hypothetical protein ACRDPI_05825, partial [Nocardioidaceae bacterium]
AGSSNVVPLAPRRRWPARLVAAAAVCLVVAGVATILTRGGGGSDTAASSTASQSRASTTHQEAAGGAAAPTSPAPKAQTSTGSAFDGLKAVAALPALHPQTMARDLHRVARLVGTRANYRAANGTPVACPALTDRERRAWLPARWDGRVVAVLLGPVHNGEREASVYSCESRGAPLAAYAVPAP